MTLLNPQGNSLKYVWLESIFFPWMGRTDFWSVMFHCPICSIPRLRFFQHFWLFFHYVFINILLVYKMFMYSIEWWLTLLNTAILNTFDTLFLIAISITGPENFPSLVNFCLNVAIYYGFDFVINRYTIKCF